MLFSKSLKMDFFQLKAGNILYDIRYGNAFTVIGLILSLLGFFSGELLYFVGLN